MRRDDPIEIALTFQDLKRVVEDIGTDCLPCDLNLDGRVDDADIGLLLARIIARSN